MLPFVTVLGKAWHAAIFWRIPWLQKSHPRLNPFSAGKNAAGFPDGNFGLSWCTAVIPGWTRRFSMWRLRTVRCLSLYSRLQTTTLGGYCWQTRSHPVKSKHAKLDAIFPLLRSHVGCHRVELREFDDVPFVFCSLFVVVQNSKAQTLVVESKQLHHTPRLVRNQNQKWFRHLFTNATNPSNPSKYGQKKNEILPK